MDQGGLVWGRAVLCEIGRLGVGPVPTGRMKFFSSC